ncbi:hypothetical protein ACFGVR_02060 [Mucilaginibacter sp. AW1-3]
MKAKIELRQVRDFGEIISDSILFIRQNWKALLKTYFVFCGFFIAANIIFTILFQLKVVNLHKEQVYGNTPASAATIFSWEYFLLLIFSFANLISLLLTTLSFVTLYNEKNNEAPNIEEVWAYYKYYFLRATGSFLLLCLIFIGAGIVLLLPGGLAVFAAGPLIGGFITFFVIVLPIIYFVTVLSLFYPIMIMENGGFGFAFGKCFKLIKGRWWNTFGVLFINAILVYAAMLLVMIPFALLSGGSITFLAYNVPIVITILYTIMLAIMQIINILPIISISVTYFSYAEEKESVGLMERIDEIGLGSDDLDPISDEY